MAFSFAISLHICFKTTGKFYDGDDVTIHGDAKDGISAYTFLQNLDNVFAM